VTEVKQCSAPSYLLSVISCDIWKVKSECESQSQSETKSESEKFYWSQTFCGRTSRKSATVHRLQSGWLLEFAHVCSCHQKVGKRQVSFGTAEPGLRSKPCQTWMENTAECVTVYLGVLLLMP